MNKKKAQYIADKIEHESRSYFLVEVRATLAVLGFMLRALNEYERGLPWYKQMVPELSEVDIAQTIKHVSHVIEAIHAKPKKVLDKNPIG